MNAQLSCVNMVTEDQASSEDILLAVGEIVSKLLVRRRAEALPHQIDTPFERAQAP